MAQSENSAVPVPAVEEIQKSWHELTLKVRQLDAELTMVEQENKVLRSLLERIVEHRQKSHAEMVSILTTLVTKLPINDIGVIVSRLVEHNMQVNEVCAALAKGKMDDNQLQPVILKVLEKTKDELAAHLKVHRRGIAQAGHAVRHRDAAIADGEAGRFLYPGVPSAPTGVSSRARFRASASSRNSARRRWFSSRI